MRALARRVKVNTATTGTGTLTSGTAVSGFQTAASAGAVSGQVFTILIETSGGAWEVSSSTYTSAGPTWTRTLIASSTGSLLNLTSATTNTIAVIVDSDDHVTQITPQGRLTLTTAVPVLTSDVTAATTIYYTPYVGSWVPIYDGTQWTVQQFSELSQATTDATKSPAACVAHSCYDLFGWDDAGTLRCTRGPRWVVAQTFTVTIASPAVFTATAHGLSEGFPVVFSTTGALPTGLTAGTVYFVISAGLTANAFEVSTSVGGSAVNTSGTQSGTHTATDSNIVRGTGAGTTELERVNGLWVNKVAITNGPGAQKGTYVGTIRTNGSSQVDYIIGGTGAAGGESTILGVWNAYNRVNVSLINYDNTDTWTYTTATYRVKNGNMANRIALVCGLSEDGLSAVNAVLSVNSSVSIFRGVAIGLNNTTTGAVGSFTGSTQIANTGLGEAVAHYHKTMPLGFNAIYPLERSTASGTTTWRGDNGGTDTYSSFMATVRA